MNTFLNHLQYWHWLSFGMVLMVFEIIGAGGVLLWCGIAAIVVGVLLWLMPSLPWELQLFLFAVFSIVSVVLWRLYWKKHPPQSEQPLLNQRAQRLIGHEFILPEALSPEQPIRMQLAGTTWTVRAQTAFVAHTKVKVTRISANEVTVEALIDGE